jgi:hypothetical protein
MWQAPSLFFRYQLGKQEMYYLIKILPFEAIWDPDSNQMKQQTWWDNNILKITMNSKWHMWMIRWSWWTQILL